MNDFSYQFYPGDVLRQTRFFNLKQKGCYLDVLSVHIENIRFSYDFIMKITSELSETEKAEFLKIFTQDSDGYFIEWAVSAIEKRRNYIASRSKNKEGKTKNHMIITSESYGKQIQIQKQIKKGNKKQVSENKKNEAKSILEKFNEVTGSKFKSVTEGFVSSYSFWAETYTPEEIMKAIENIPSNEYWSDKMTPVILFRKTDQKNNPVDYIGMLLNQKSVKPSASAQKSERGNFVYP